MDVHSGPLNEVKHLLGSLKRAVAVCQQQVGELENSEGEVSTRHMEINNVSARLHQSNLQLQGNVGHQTEIQAHVEILAQQLHEWYGYMYGGRQKTMSHIVDTRDVAGNLQHKLVNEALLKWKRQQKIGQIGAETSGLNAELDEMEPLFDGLLTELVRLRSAVDGFNLHIRRLPVSSFGSVNGQVAHITSEQVEQLGTEINEQITNLLWECCVVAVQPPYILMMTRTPASDHQRRGGRTPCQPVLRFLGGTRLGIRSQPIPVSCYLISEEEAPNILKGDMTALDDIIGQRTQKQQKKDTGLPLLMNNKATMLEQVDRFYAIFPRMEPSTDRIRIPKKKYYFLFVIELCGAGISKPLKIWRLSMPVGVFSHPKQVREQGGDASLFWNLAFSQGDGILQEPDHNGVPAQEFVTRLNEKFLQYTGATRGLSSMAQKHIVEKLTGSPDNGIVTWHSFYEKQIGKDENGPFTFREWFYSVMDMINTRKGLIEQWNAGLILGFAGRYGVDRLLSQQKEKTLAIKFSDGKRHLIISYGHAGVPILHVLPVAEQMPMLGSLPVEQVVKTTTQLQDVRWVYGQSNDDVASSPGPNLSTNGPVWPVELLWTVTEQQSDTGRKSSQPTEAADDSQDPYKRLHLNAVVCENGMQIQQQFLIGPAPSTDATINKDLLDLLNFEINSPDGIFSPGAADTPMEFIGDGVFGQQ